MKPILCAFALIFLSACGYKSALYLPKPDDKATFGVIQTGLDLQHSDTQKTSKP